MQERLLGMKGQIEGLHSAAGHPIIPERKDLRLTGNLESDRRREEFIALSSTPYFLHLYMLHNY